jgi:hypothetical protein
MTAAGWIFALGFLTLWLLTRRQLRAVRASNRALNWDLIRIRIGEKPKLRSSSPQDD